MAQRGNEHDKIDILEKAIMEMGAEVYRLRHDVQVTHQSYQKIVDLIKGLKVVLDDKGLISQDDFESAVEISQAILSTHLQPSFLDEIEKLKKNLN